MTTTYREVRLANLGDALGFNKERGSAVAPQQVRHDLSLAVHADGEITGYALCVEEDGHHVVEMALTAAASERGLGKPLADTALRKMQCAGYGTARIRSLNDDEIERLWESANWLERVPCWGKAEEEEGGETAQSHPEEEQAPTGEAVQTA